MDWNTAEEIARFDALWKLRGQHCHVSSWNRRADDWEQELRHSSMHREKNAFRVDSAAAFLRSHGLLGSGDQVIDIGCGLGRFAAEFAKTAGHVTAADLSEQMLCHGRAFAEEEGLENLTFTACDFRNADLDALGWKDRFDLVFTSLSPAVSCGADLERLEYISRGWCAYQTFACTCEPVGQAIADRLFPGVPRYSHKDGRSYYAAFNLLWLRGRFPLTHQYCESRVERLPAGMPLANKIARQLPQEAVTEEILERIYRCVMESADPEGMIDYPSDYWYGILLWNVKETYPRDYRTEGAIFP